LPRARPAFRRSRSRSIRSGKRSPLRSAQTIAAEADKWRGCQQELFAVGQVAVDAETYAKGRKVTKAREQELRDKLHQVGVQLTAIGTKYGITSLELTANQSTSFSNSERQAVLNANRAAHGGKYQCEHCGFRNSNEVRTVPGRSHHPAVEGRARCGGKRTGARRHVQCQPR